MQVRPWRQRDRLAPGRSTHREDLHTGKIHTPTAPTTRRTVTNTRRQERQPPTSNHRRATTGGNQAAAGIETRRCSAGPGTALAPIAAQVPQRILYRRRHRRRALCTHRPVHAERARTAARRLALVLRASPLQVALQLPGWPDGGGPRAGPRTRTRAVVTNPKGPRADGERGATCRGPRAPCACCYSPGAAADCTAGPHVQGRPHDRQPQLELRPRQQRERGRRGHAPRGGR